MTEDEQTPKELFGYTEPTGPSDPAEKERVEPTWKLALIAWREDARSHFVLVDERNKPEVRHTLCGLGLPYANIWDAWPEKRPSCKKCAAMSQLLQSKDELTLRLEVLRKMDENAERRFRLRALEVAQRLSQSNGDKI
jgi:hypothetical protein